MDYVSALALGLALAMDAMAVSVTCGMGNGRKTQALQTAFLFGIFQMIMPVLGWSIGKVGSGIIAEFDHIIAFGILLFLGIKMLSDAKKQDISGMTLSSTKDLVMAAVAVSIDALASGIVLPVSVKAFTVMQMMEAVILIGFVTFVLSLAGYAAGMKISRIKPQYAGMTGGAVLILIGIKTLVAG